MAEIENILKSERYKAHGELLCSSFKEHVGRPLLKCINEEKTLISQLYNAPFALLSHGTEEDPIFNFGNKKAMDYFEIEWEALLQMPSRLSAEPVNRDERARLIQAVTANGYIDNYSGVRISAKGNRFVIKQAIVWNLTDSTGIFRGQAAMFDSMYPLPKL